MKIAFVYVNRDGYVNRGAGYVASTILDAGYNLDFFNTAYQPLSEVCQSVIDGKYSVLMISASTLFYSQAKELAKEVKKHIHIPVVLGGAHATVIRTGILSDCAEIDYVCVGEGEQFVLDFLQRIKSGQEVSVIDNLCYRDSNGKPKANSVGPCTNLDTLPEFSYSLFPPEAVVQPYPLPGFCYVYATRGCPYRCSYCGNSVYLDIYHKSYLRTRNIDVTISEMMYLKKRYPVEFFYFGDEMLLFDEKYAHELLMRVYDQVKLPYGCMVRVEKVTPDIAELFQKTGCGYVGMGVECGDEQFRKQFLNRHMTNEQIIGAFALLRDIPGMHLTAFTMQGFPVSYDDDLTEKTEDLIRILKPDFTPKNTFYPFPGTKLYAYCIENDLIDLDKLENAVNVSGPTVLKPMK